MIAKTRQPSAQEPGPLHISPALEATTNTEPLSTHWIPLHELIDHWTTLGTMLDPAPVAPILTALGNAFLACADETQALRYYVQGWLDHETAPHAATTRRFAQTRWMLGKAARHWGRAAGNLECLAPIDLGQAAAAAERIRRLAEVARSQQVRMYALIEEVCADVRAWRSASRAHGRSPREAKEVG